MLFGKYKTVLVALAAGFLIVGLLEWKRTTFAESYWLLLLALTSLLAFQYFRLHEKAPEGQSGTTVRKGKPAGKSKGSRK